MRYPVAWIAQDFRRTASDEWETWDGESELTPPSMAPARCQASCPAWALIDTGDQTGEEREWQSIDEAIAWARALVPRVLVRIGYSEYYSAGSEPVAGYPTWPPTEEAIRSETLH